MLTLQWSCVWMECERSWLFLPRDHSRVKVNIWISYNQHFTVLVLSYTWPPIHFFYFFTDPSYFFMCFRVSNRLTGAQQTLFLQIFQHIGALVLDSCQKLKIPLASSCFFRFDCVGVQRPKQLNVSNGVYQIFWGRGTFNLCGH